MSSSTTSVPASERALVLQGGGSLGAYEAGAYKALHEWLSKKDKEEGKETSITFDNIAGTSIGAMNAAVLTSYVVENGTYEGSADRLIDFWKYLSKESIADTNPWFKPWWDYLHSIDKAIATGEAARRYYSAKEFVVAGVPHAFSPPIPTRDNRFFDPIWNTWYRFSNEPLRKSLERFAKFPIATAFEENQPRLLLVAVDVAKGAPVTFDSYAKEDGSRKTEYGRYIKKEDGKEIGFEHVIRYDDGITIDQVMASGCFPVNFDYTLLEVESYYHHDSVSDNHNYSFPHGSRISTGISSPPHHDFSKHYRKEIRHFWDGGMLYNTPLTQLVLLHRNYWYRIKALKEKVPTLNICVINVHPTTQTQIPTDHDGVIDRKNDITFSDRSHKDEEVLLLVSDYIELVRELIILAKEAGVKDKDISSLLNQRTKYHGMNLRPRLYKEIVEGRFDINKIIRIERENDENTISDKTFDFSSGTIMQLIKDGFEDTTDLINNILGSRLS
ncbi:MAG TPA: patatin-like phospholipase family protein [Nitrososphaeraceae archaeon]|nr:patatin-like phospholipase family protein [Nitrososphaeraceae archaeon]